MRVCAVGLGLLAFGCVAAPAPLAPVPGPDSHAASASPVLSPAVTRAVAASIEPAATGPAIGTEPAPATAAAELPPPEVLIETPYSALGHPRLATEMLTLGRDDELFQWALGGTGDPEHASNRPGYHPATRVVVDVELLSRAPKGSTHRLLATARSSGYWPLRSCFETAQRLAPKSERSARVRLSLGAGGKVLGARGVGTPTERVYARCVVERLRALDFTPGFTRKLDVEISLRQWPGHAPLPPRAPDDAPPVHLSNDGRATLEALSPALGDCYKTGLSADPKLWGRIALRLELGEGGTVAQATPVETRFPNAAVTECARQAVLGARLGERAPSELTFAVRLGAQGTAPAPAPPAGAPAAPVSLPPAPAVPEH